MTSACSNCGVEVEDADVSCPVCGEDDFQTDPPASGGERLAAAFAYLALVPALILLLLARFKKNPFIRFHCFQSIFLVAACLILAGALRIFFVIFTVIPFLISALIVTIFSLACFVVWIVLLVKALQGRRFKLPWIGTMADNQTGGD